MVCPDRFITTAKKSIKYLPALNVRLLGYSYNDCWVSDSCYGLTCQRFDPITMRNIRLGRFMVVIMTSAVCVVFGDTFDIAAYSIAIDNIFSGAVGPTTTRQMRHMASLNYCFVDGHAKIIHMQAGNYSGYGLTARPASEVDALKWCYDPNATPDSSFQGPPG